MNPKTSDPDLQEIQTLLHCILQIPGDKIVTLVTRNNTLTIDIKANGQIGYEIGHKEFFILKLHRALIEGGGMTIREFLPMRIARKLKNGQTMWIPEKNLYGIAFQSGKWLPLEATEVQATHETDYKTGALLPQEEGVHYRTLQKVNSS